MNVRTDRGIALCMAASLLAGLSGCTAIDESVKADLASAPKANPRSPEMQAAMAAEAATNGAAVKQMTQAELAAANPGPAPIIPGTATAAPIPALKASALSPTAPQTAATDALAMVTTPTATSGSQQMAAAAAPTQETLVAPAAVAAATSPATESESPQVVLAYAAPLRATALTSFGDPFDISPPGEPDALNADRKPATVGPTRLNALIEKYSKLYEIPADLVHRVVHRESRYNPAAYSKGNYGLMQIRYNTAKAMGYDGPANGLFDAETNIKYAVKYLKGAWVVADNDHDQAVRLYARGYYYDAKRKGLLHLTR
ncbi:transglycosylase SLT domain-containing protein [Rhizobium sp. AQ_MP]|uniref:lytic transglycosylase domain-containing protein n=1 Tax=Rhizobium sp. AQ_MP TaxID=2761536 RepID=UPI00163A0665|nr:lytic transglycosylase domain-containing protein [Rhizobium sp. AQ_MP]MBC2774885.1 transglycosylase SLT domain-containing protein [Rhizobium sp. AQ_MP]